jgi:hypothetical protein
MGAHKTKKATGCGCDCGCGGKKPAGSGCCACDDSPETCGGTGVLRPSFFAGQLLTEDDLQQITAYQNSKRRLTNRYLFGTGVVCGLDVVCGDSPGTVTVNCGYALDCCGNDIFLSCPVTIDINEKIRSLPCNCGEPCDNGGRRYQLCVSYAEVSSEPASAYSPGATATCSNTRVQETCTFDLRCAPKECKPPDDLSSRITKVLEDCQCREITDVDLARFTSLYAHKDDLIPLKPITLVDQDFMDLSAASTASTTGTTGTTGAASTTGTASPLDLNGDMTDDALNAAVDRLVTPARAFARFQYFDPSKITRAIPSGTTFTSLPDLQSKLPAIGKYLSGEIAKLSPKQHHASPETALRIALLNHDINLWNETDTTRLAKTRERVDVRLFVVANDTEPYNFARYTEALGALSQQFVDLSIPTRDDFTYDDLKAAGPLATRYKKEGINGCVEALCKIVNPPCTPCDDLCVVLATIEVKACKIEWICCNVRKIIISPAALGYWLPLQEILCKLCCCPSDGDGRHVLMDTTLDPFKQAIKVLYPPPPPSHKKAEGGKL